MFLFSSFFEVGVASIIPAILVGFMVLFSIFYNTALGSNHTKNYLMLLAGCFSIMAILSKNIILTFTGIELLSLTCYFIVAWSRGVHRRLALMYLLTHSFSGVIMILYITMQYSPESLHFIKASPLFEWKELPLLISLSINLALFPFFGWYTRVYSRTDSFSIILLSFITTKTSFFIMWKVMQTNALFFQISLVSFAVASVFALLTTNVIKFILYASITSLSFASMVIAYPSPQILAYVSAELMYQICFYMASSALAIAGFLVLYGYITNNDEHCQNSSFKSLSEYFKNYGSSMHFVVPAIIFALFLASFPYTASFVAKTNITKFFVTEKPVYLAFKFSQIIFTIFAIRLVLPVFHSIEFLRLDKTGRRFSIVLYIIVANLLGLSAYFLLKNGISVRLFTLSTEFFTFVAFIFGGGGILFGLNILFKVVRLKVVIEFCLKKISHFKHFISKISHKIHPADATLFLILRSTKPLKAIASFSSVTPSASVLMVLALLFGLFFGSTVPQRASHDSAQIEPRAEVGAVDRAEVAFAENKIITQNNA